jgi:hypothetical protein
MAVSAPQSRICAELRSGIRVSVLISAPFLKRGTGAPDQALFLI